MIIGNLVLDPPARKRLAGTPALLERVLAALAARDAKTLRFATGALRNLSVDPAGRARSPPPPLPPASFRRANKDRAGRGA
jgi:hypothetical protein